MSGAGANAELGGNCPDPVAGVARTAALKTFAAALAELVAWFYGHPEYPLPTKIDLWAHQYGAGATEAAVDAFCASVFGVQRLDPRIARVDDLTPGYGLGVDFTLIVHPTDQPGAARALGSSQP